MTLNKGIRLTDPVVFIDNIDSSDKYWGAVPLHSFEDFFVTRTTTVEKDKGMMTPMTNIHKIGGAGPREFEDTVLFLYHESVNFLTDAQVSNIANLHNIRPEEIMTRMLGYTSDCLRSHRHDDTLELRVNRLFR